MKMWSSHLLDNLSNCLRQLLKWDNCLNCPASTRIISSFDFKRRTSYNISFNSLCIFKTKASLGPKLWSYFNFYSLYKIWKYQLHRISESEFYEWLLGAFSGPKSFRDFQETCPRPDFVYEIWEQKDRWLQSAWSHLAIFYDVIIPEPKH